MAEETKVKLFREKSLEAIESPESLNDYLHVTSPGVWLVLAAVIALLVGGVLWGIFGRIDTTVRLAVSSGQEGTVCYVPYDALEKVIGVGKVTVNGEDYALRSGSQGTVAVMSEETNPYILVTGNLQIGDVTVAVPLDASLPEGVYAADAVVESLQPLSLLLQ